MKQIETDIVLDIVANPVVGSPAADFAAHHREVAGRDTKLVSIEREWLLFDFSCRQKGDETVEQDLSLIGLLGVFCLYKGAQRATELKDDALYERVYDFLAEGGLITFQVVYKHRIHAVLHDDFLIGQTEYVMLLQEECLVPDALIRVENLLHERLRQA